MQTHKVILGQAPWLEMATEDWLQAQPGLSLTQVEVVLDRSYGFDLSALGDLDPSNTTGFVAWGPKFLNFQRLELMGELKKRGFKMPALVHPSAQVSPTATFQENAWIQAQAIIGPAVSVGLNAQVGLGARLGPHSYLGNHAWLGQDVRIGARSRVEAHAVVGDGVKVADSVRIGRQACIETPGMIATDWPDKAFRLRSSGLVAQIIEHRPSATS
jgi:UDP-3-O-[3-hydroxymyristoyl] glucosamine N-acyltransferase